MKLTDPWFDARFYGASTATGFRDERDDGTPYSLAEAQGLMLWCPCGYGKPEYPLDGARPHAILVPFANPPSGVPCHSEHGPIGRGGARPRWEVGGTGLHDLTIRPSIAVGAPNECWHGYITAGEVTR